MAYENDKQICETVGSDVSTSPVRDALIRLHNIADRANAQAGRIEEMLHTALRQVPSSVKEPSETLAGGASPLVSELNAIADKLEGTYSWLATTEDRLTL